MSLSPIDNATVAGSYQYSEGAHLLLSFELGDSGSKLFTLDGDEDIRVHALGTAYDISTAAAGSQGSFFGSWSTHARTRIKPDGTKAITHAGGGEIQSNTFNTPWDVGNIDLSRGTSDLDLASGDTATATPRRGLAVGNGGSTFVVSHLTGGRLLAYSMGTPWEVGNQTLVSEVDITAPPHNISGADVHDMDFNSDETSLLVVDVGNNQLHHFAVGTPGDITTLSLNESYDFSGEIPVGITVAWVQVSVSDNDEHFYLGFLADSAGDNSTIQQYDVPVVTLTPVESAHETPIPLRVEAAHETRWTIEMAVAHTTPIPLRLEAAHETPIREQVEAAHETPIAYLEPVEAAHVTVFDLEAFVPVEAAHETPIPLRVEAAHTAPATLMTVVEAAHATVFDLRVTVEAAHATVFDLRDHNLVESAHETVFSLLSAPRTELQMAVTLTAGGQSLAVLSWRLGTDEGGYLYEGEVAVDANGYGLVDVNDAVTLDLFGEAYELVVESKSRDRDGPADRRWMLGVRSPTVRFDFPRAEPVTRTFEQDVLARTAVETLLGEAVSWDLVDWPIPAFRLAFEQASPIAAAQQIVQAPGGTIQTDPDGTLRIRHLYPESPKHRYADVTPDRIVDDQSQVVRAGEAFEPRRLVDRLSIRDTLEGVFRDRLEFEPDEADERAGLVRVYPSPWRTNLVVTHTSNASLQLTHLGEVTREETEVVEFAAGTASVQFPVDALLSVSWLYVSLGGVSFEPYSTELQAADSDGYSLAEITYRTRSIDYRLVSPTVDQAQLLLQEVA